jgi:hypothetical protein
MKKFPKLISKDGWTSLETIIGQMNGEYPYYFLMCHPGEENDPRNNRHGYEVLSEEDEKLNLKCFSKRLRFKGMKTKPNWWP